VPPSPSRAAVRHVVLIGYGRVGRRVAETLRSRGTPLIVIEDQADMARDAETDGVAVVRGNAADPQVLEAAGLDRADTVLITIPEGYEGGAIFQHARSLNPTVRVIARAHSDAEVAHLEGLGVPEVVMGEREIALRMIALCANARQEAA